MFKRFLKTSRYLTFASLIIFIGCEAYLRIYKSENMVLHQFPAIYKYDSSRGFRGIPNMEGYIRRPSIDKKFRLNNFGFYGPDFSAIHPENVFRILVCGSSVVEGIWANQEKSYPEMLGDLFRESGYRVEVINCGVSGSNRDWQNMKLIREESVRLHANLVLFEEPVPMEVGNYLRDNYKGYSILFTGDNSSEWRQSEAVVKRKVDLLNANSFVNGMYDLSYCIRFLTRSSEDSWNTIMQCWKNYADNSCASWQYYVSRDKDVRESLYTLNDLSADLTKIDCKLVVFEYGNHEYSNRIRASDEVKFPYLSLALPLDQKAYQHPLDDHPNYQGFKIISQKLFDEISMKYIPAAFGPLNKSVNKQL